MRVAAALVVGQVLLCAVIGWVTFRSGQTRRPDSVPPADPLAAKPLAIPPPVVVPPPSPKPSASSSAARKAALSTEPSARASSKPPPSPPAPAEARKSPATRPPLAAQPDLVVPTPEPDASVQSPVKVLDPCDPVDATGLTADGVSVRCVEGDDGTLRWQIN